MYCGAYFGSYLYLIFHIEYTNKVNLQGIGLSNISFSFLNEHLWVFVKIVDLMIKE